MTLAEGSKADLPCPRCRSSLVKVALNTADATYYLCSQCAHAWAIPRPKPEPARSDDPRRTKAGYLLAVEGCMPSATGARVRLSDGRITVTDGPFTESKEVVGGFAILQAASKDDAIELARLFLRAAGDGECELRELFVAGEAAPATT